MATFRGQDGSVHIGGVIFTLDQPVTNGAVSSGDDTVTVHAGAGKDLRGVILSGDTFTVAAATTVYTVDTITTTPPGKNTDGAIVNDTITFDFTPDAAATWATASDVYFAAHSVAQIKSWSATVTREKLDASYMGLASKQYRLGQIDWNGNAEVLFDYGDPYQKKVMDLLLANTDVPATLTLRADDGKQFYGKMFISGGDVTNETNALAMFSVEFQGTSALRVDWN